MDSRWIVLQKSLEKIELYLKKFQKNNLILIKKSPSRMNTDKAEKSTNFLDLLVPHHGIKKRYSMKNNSDDESLTQHKQKLENFSNFSGTLSKRDS